MVIIGVIISLIIPFIKEYILKARFEESKASIQKIALAQERYKNIHGKYEINSENETYIAEFLGVSLRESNNFHYGITNSEGGSNYTVVASLRFTKDGTCNDDANYCKQLGTPPREDWVDKYNTIRGNHYIEFNYPTLNQTGSHFNYDNISKGN